MGIEPRRVAEHFQVEMKTTFKLWFALALIGLSVTQVEAARRPPSVTPPPIVVTTTVDRPVISPL
jgi:hypothetical protein